jgi:uncharacterized membrane protein (Fun14 family)
MTMESYDDDVTTDPAPFAGTVGGGFLIGLITGYAIKKVVKPKV